MDCSYKVIKVTNSNFGRSAPYASVCPHPGGSNEDLACTYSIADKLLPCDDQHQCQVAIFQPTSDPCYGTGKYAEVDYICESELQPGPRLNIKTLFPGMGISMLKLRRSRDRLIFNTEIPIPVRRYLYIETGP